MTQDQYASYARQFLSDNKSLLFSPPGSKGNPTDIDSELEPKLKPVVYEVFANFGNIHLFDYHETWGNGHCGFEAVFSSLVSLGVENFYKLILLVIRF